MAGTNKTLKDLQDYAVNPPPGLFEKLWKRIRRLKPGDKIPAKDSTIPETHETDAGIVLSEEEVLPALRSYSATEKKPPPFDYRKLSLAIGENETAVITKKNFPLFYLIAAAAAIAGIVISVFYFSSKKSDQAKSEISLAQNSHPNNSAQVPMQSNAQVSTPETLYKKKSDVTQQYRAKAISPLTTTTRDKQADPNDFIYSFTSFTYNEAKNFLKGLKKNKKISIDKYSYLNISDKMEDFLKKMYEVNKKEKPTHKAKKLRSKLAKWKKKDEKYFDRKKEKNPLDIIDLSELILK